MGMGNGSAEEREADRELRLYLMGRLPADRLAGLLPRLLTFPSDKVATDVRAWARGQTGPATFREYVSAGFRRLLALSAHASVDVAARDALFRAVADALVASAPPEDREKLSADVAQLLASGRPAAPPDRTPPRVPAVPAASPRRLTLILDRLDSTGVERGHGRGAALLGEAVLTAALASSSPAELEASLQDMRRRSLFRGTDELFRVLVQALPSWPLPDLTAKTAPAASALERLVGMAPDAAQAKERFYELVDAGADTFNHGALERAELVYSVAERLLDRGVVEASAVEPLRAGGHERLDLERLRRLLEGEDRREVPRSLLRFYRVFDPSALLDKLRREPARQRRRLLLAFLEAHGTDGRHAAFERLGRSLEDQQDVFLGRNLIHLLRRIPGEQSPWMPARELGRVVRFLVPENPPFLVREVLAYLAEKRHPVAEQALRHFVTTLEEALLGGPGEGGGAERDQWRHYLDETCSALARHGTPGAWQAVVDHGLRTEPELGHAAARLAELGGHDLGGQPALVARLVAAAVAEIPRKVLARPTAAQAERLRHAVAALADTRTAEVQELLETLAGRFADEDFGRRAARILANAGAGGGGGFDASAGATLSGDLRVFGLPTLLQSLADSRVTGVMRLVDVRGRKLGTLEFEGGLLAGARYGSLEGAEVVYQLLERPVRATFVFVPRPPAVSGADEAAPTKEKRAPRDVTRLLLEGLRRHDELRRASVIVPDDARLATTDRPPRAVGGEEDIDLVISLWEKVVAGMTPQQCERTLAADAYRVRRCLVGWVEEGALRLCPPDGR
jgi:Domain of unknown function (DUF4388)